MNGHLLMHIYDIAGGRNIGINNASNAINDINAKTKNQKGRTWEITSTSTFTGGISAPKIYTKTEVNQLLTGSASSFDITAAIPETADTSTTCTKSDLENLWTGKASSSDITSAIARTIW